MKRATKKSHDSRQGVAATLILAALLHTVSGWADGADTASVDADQEPTRDDEGEAASDTRLALPRTIELALFPMLTQRQIEGSARDDLVTNEPHLGVLLTGTWAVLEWLEPGIATHFDVGSSRNARFTLPNAAGETAESVVVEGSYWEFWLVLLVRARADWAFFELGWAPLMLRGDDARTDLPNQAGETDGVFAGSRSVAFLASAGAAVPLGSQLELTLRLEARIRYLVERGGEPLAGAAEFGQMALWPFVGLAYRF